MTPLAVASATIVAHLMPGVGVIHTIIDGWRPHGKNFFRHNGSFWSGCGHRSGLMVRII
jgi:hypothetical protein